MSPAIGIVSAQVPSIAQTESSQTHLFMRREKVGVKVGAQEAEYPPAVPQRRKKREREKKNIKEKKKEKKNEKHFQAKKKKEDPIGILLAQHFPGVLKSRVWSRQSSAIGFRKACGARRWPSRFGTPSIAKLGASLVCKSKGGKTSPNSVRGTKSCRHRPTSKKKRPLPLRDDFAPVGMRFIVSEQPRFQQKTARRKMAAQEVKLHEGFSTAGTQKS